MTAPQTTTDPAGNQQGGPPGTSPVRPSDVRLVQGYLRDDELAAIAVVISAMSVTSRLEAEERTLAEGQGAGAGAWADPVHGHPRAHGLRGLPSPAAWQFSDR
ncbi:MAG: hypothetical protein ACTH43_02395 [Brachybacterium sp.]|uniref:hypothetical protein n=1 Tax=Brachybacterium sp. TaxID=1891286 RepID=UPI003F92EC3A